MRLLPSQVEGYAGDYHIRLEKQGSLDEQRALIVKQMVHHLAGTNSGSTTVTKSSGRSASTRSRFCDPRTDPPGRR